MSRASVYEKPAIVFFGTGPVSAATLKGIHQDFDVQLVVTKPLSLNPRGKAHPHPVLELCEQLSLPVVTVSRRSDMESYFLEHPPSVSTGLVVDFGIIIPKSVIDCFAMGIVNSHFSLLPALRGADPISGAILAGDSTTGVSLMNIVAALDEGPLLAQKQLEIPPTSTTPELTELLLELSNKCIQEVLPRYMNGLVEAHPQPSSPPATYTRKLSKADGVIDWGLPATIIERQVRAYAGWPGSRAVIAGRDVIVTQTMVAAASVSDSPLLSVGQIGRSVEGQVVVGCGHNTSLVINRLKPAGKSEMTSQALMAGIR
jgi:methionyl-tRNA formyltransferase